MEKSKLVSFISRYYLGGNCEAVTLKEDGNSINCELIDGDQTVVGKIKWNTTPFMKGALGINHTGALTKMLSAVNENINIDDIRELFLEQFPNEELHMESYITDFLS